MYKHYLILISLILYTSNILAQNSRANGYKGIWFTLGQYSAYGDKYSGGLGTYTSSHTPIAIYSKPVNKTFFVYGGTTQQDEKHLLIMISFFDHKKKIVPKPVIVYDKKNTDDPHDNASLSIDDKGYIWVFVSGRNTVRPGLIFKSSTPYQIDKFEQILTGEMTYPQPWFVKDKGFVYLFTKYTKGRELYWTTSKGGDIWEPEQKLAGMGGHYQISNIKDGKLVTAFNYHPGGDVNKRTNIYLLQTDDMGKTWKNIHGEIMPTPLINKQSKALVKDYESERKLVYLNDLNFDEQGNPVILTVVSTGFEPGPKSDPRDWMIIHWKNGQWNFHKVSSSTHNYDMGSLYIDKKTWQIVGPTEPGPQKYGAGGEIALWESKDEGLTWIKKRRVTQNSIRNHTYVRRPLNAQNEFYAFWADGNTDAFSESVLYYSNKKGKVRILPYQMDKDFEKPLQLKVNHR
ncbi:BNR-4 repeat-containing protein [Daejeonella sp.]|uniref:BNR-4 repeat-containing protein n=1 Tax=Daejeonella sp. TaxID=2805397 RepID=UPI0030C1F10E